MSSLFGLSNANYLYFLTERSFLLPPDMDILGWILGSEIMGNIEKVAGLFCDSSGYVSDRRIDNYCNVNELSVGGLVQFWLLTHRLQPSLRSSHGILFFALI